MLTLKNTLYDIFHWVSTGVALKEFYKSWVIFNNFEPQKKKLNNVS